MIDEATEQRILRKQAAGHQLTNTELAQYVVLSVKNDLANGVPYFRTDGTPVDTIQAAMDALTDDGRLYVQQPPTTRSTS